MTRLGKRLMYCFLLLILPLWLGVFWLLHGRLAYDRP